MKVVASVVAAVCLLLGAGGAGARPTMVEIGKDPIGDGGIQDLASLELGRTRDFLKVRFRLKDDLIYPHPGNEFGNLTWWFQVDGRMFRTEVTFGATQNWFRLYENLGGRWEFIGPQRGIHAQHRGFTEIILPLGVLGADEGEAIFGFPGYSTDGSDAQLSLGYDRYSLQKVDTLTTTRSYVLP